MTLALAIFYVIQAVVEELGHVGVDTVKHLATLPTRFDQSHLPQHAQVVRDSRFTQIDRFGECADILFSFDEHGDEAHAAGVTEGAKQFGHVGRRVLIESGRVFDTRISRHSCTSEHLFRYCSLLELGSIVKGRQGPLRIRPVPRNREWEGVLALYWDDAGQSSQGSRLGGGHS